MNRDGRLRTEATAHLQLARPTNSEIRSICSLCVTRGGRFWGWALQLNADRHHRVPNGTVKRARDGSQAPGNRRALCPRVSLVKQEIRKRPPDRSPGGRFPHRLPEVGARRPPFFSRVPSRLLRRQRAVCEASASIPRPDGRPTWFVVASAASRSGRGPISHTAFRCAASERMEHATGSICPTGVTTGIDRRLSPWLRQRPPPIFRSDRLPFAVEAGGLNTFPAKRELNIEAPRNRASACLSSVYTHPMWIGCGTLTA